MGQNGTKSDNKKITNLNYPAEKHIFLHSNPPKYMNAYVKIITLENSGYFY